MSDPGHEILVADIAVFGSGWFLLNWSVSAAFLTQVGIIHSMTNKL